MTRLKDEVELFVLEVFAAPASREDEAYIGLRARLGMPEELLPPGIKELLENSVLFITKGINELQGAENSSFVSVKGPGAVNTKVAEYFKEQGIAVDKDDDLIRRKNGEKWH